MSQRAFSLPIRTIATKAVKPQWICRRCLATQQSSLTASEKYSKGRTSELLSTQLPQKHLPPQVLSHVNAESLPINEQEQWEKVEPHKKIVGVVVSHGKMDKTVRVRIAAQRWNQRIKKYYRHDINHLVHDPNDSLTTGDVVELHRLKVSKQVEHVVARIISPFGKPVEERPPVPTPEERLADYKAKRMVKLRRRELRIRAGEGDAEAIQKLKEMGHDPGAGAKPGVGRKDNVQQNVGKSRTPSSGAILGSQGQKLPEGVLPGGKEEVGKINERAQHNKGKAMKFDAKAEERILEAQEKDQELAKEGLTSDSALR
ncbi:37S ribosomal protein S17, mitochondrial [Pseudocercospora fuligena]|uniref:37S ribosomal protein S17, mitochondrial n=1 Tax=Pseudocercospora fuligena TaxID=685502 RepID=A0A8H6RTZ6_9PEZI|nr:37S ribosomal protein S17, mitochondrial [Pseudocercospora fuligena]